VWFVALDGFLAYESSIPKALLDAGGPCTGKMDINNTIGHFELVNYQLKEVRRRKSCSSIHAAACSWVLGYKVLSRSGRRHVVCRKETTTAAVV
jgi:hypothetical protein